MVGYERVVPWDRRIHAYRVTFDGGSDPRTLAGDRIRGLRRALSDRDPSKLPVCPRWMYDGCPYRPDCGCAAGAGPGIDQR